MGQINIGGANAAVQLQGNDTITTDQGFTFPDTGGEVVVTPGTADIETTGSIIAVEAISSTATGVPYAMYSATLNSAGYVYVKREAGDGVNVWVGGNDSGDTSTIDSNGNITAAGGIVSEGSCFIANGLNIENQASPTNKNKLYLSGSGNSAVQITSNTDNANNSLQIQWSGQILSDYTTILPVSSERRLKENIVPINSTDAWDTIKNTPYYSYNLIGSEGTLYGPVVDEVPAEMVIQPMVENEDGVMVARSDDQGPVRTYDNGMLQARLYTALQTALTRIEALEAEVQTLKGGAS